MTSSLRVFWWNVDHNFGDLLTSFIFEAYNIPHELSSARACDTIAIGSILEHVTRSSNNWHGTVWSTGFMHAQSRGDLSSARVLAVRGPLTRHALQLDPAQVEPVLGDGGLLLAEAAAKRGLLSERTRYALGLVPHYVDYATVAALPWVREGVECGDLCLIDVTGSVEATITQLSACAAVLSSSLHGLIVADSLGLPNRRFTVSTSHRIVGSGFKFRDYYGSLGIDAPSEVSLDALSSSSEAIEAVRKHFVERTKVPHIKEQLEETLLVLRS